MQNIRFLYCLPNQFTLSCFSPFIYCRFPPLYKPVRVTLNVTCNYTTGRNIYVFVVRKATDQWPQIPPVVSSPFQIPTLRWRVTRDQFLCVEHNSLRLEISVVYIKIHYAPFRLAEPRTWNKYRITTRFSRKPSLLTNGVLCNSDESSRDAVNKFFTDNPHAYFLFLVLLFVISIFENL